MSTYHKKTCVFLSIFIFGCVNLRAQEVHIYSLDKALKRVTATNVDNISGSTKLEITRDTVRILKLQSIFAKVRKSKKIVTRSFDSRLMLILLDSKKDTLDYIGITNYGVIGTTEKGVAYEDTNDLITQEIITTFKDFIPPYHGWYEASEQEIDDFIKKEILEDLRLDSLNFEKTKKRRKRRKN